MLVLYLKNIAKSKTGAIWVDIAAIDVYEVKTSTEPAATKAVTAFVAHYSTSICPLLSSEALLKSYQISTDDWIEILRWLWVKIIGGGSCGGGLSVFINWSCGYQPPQPLVQTL